MWTPEAEATKHHHTMKKGLTFLLSILLITQLSFSQEWVSITSANPAASEVKVSPLANGGTAVSVSLPGFFRSGSTVAGEFSGKTLFFDGVNETEAGKPDMQHLTISLRLPERGNIALNVLRSNYTEYSNYRISASNGDPGLSPEENGQYAKTNKSIYGTDGFFPGILADAGRPYIWCDTRGMAVQLFPLQYNPVTGILRVYHSIDFEVIPLNEPGINELTIHSPYSGTLNGMRSLTTSHFVNEGVSSRYTPVEESGRMLIVAPAGFMDVLKPFAEWKAALGIECDLLDVAGFNTAEELKQYVAGYYYSKGLTYLLLAGDAAQVPTLLAEKGASNNMYGYIAGDDHYPEIITGRFPAETRGQLQIMVSRSIAYEKEGKGNSAYSHFLGIAGEEGPGDDGEMDWEHIRIIGNQLLGYNYNKVTELYDGSQGGSDRSGNPEAKEVAAAIEQGQGAIMYIGHGSPRSWNTSGFSATEAAKLGNTEAHPFIWSAGCSNGDFSTTTCLAEAFLRAEKDGIPTGAVAVMASTGVQSWYPPMEAQDEIALILARRKTNVTTRTFGGISMSGCMRMNDKYGLGGYRVTDTWTIFGDPSVMVRTAAPKEIRAHHASVIGRDAREFVVKLPESEALASITHKGKLLGAARAEDGMAVISLTELPATGALTLTVSAYNHIPYTAEIEITSLPAVAVNPTPGNHTGRNSAYALLSWDTEAGTTPEFYEVFITEKGTQTWNTAPAITFENSLHLTAPLRYGTEYLWKVVSHNRFGSTESEIFAFTTIAAPDEDFEKQGFPRSSWLNNTDNPWIIDGNIAFEGKYSIRSGLTNGYGESVLAYSCHTPACDVLGFNLKIAAENGAGKLQLRIDGLTVAEWSGMLDWSEEQFAVDPGEHLIEWVYSNYSGNTAGDDAAWIDNIYLPENEIPFIITDDLTACPEENITVNALVFNFSSISWNGKGSGSFSQIMGEEAVYQPSEEDLARGYVELEVEVFTSSFCEPVKKEMLLMLNDRPEIPELRDTTLYAGEVLEISMPVNSTAGYKLLPTGSQGGIIVIRAEDLNPGPNNLTITAENESGCSNEKSFTVTLIDSKRPESESALHIYPNPASENISINLAEFGNDMVNIQIFNLAGQLVLQQETFASHSTPVAVDNLVSGVYMVKTGNGEMIRNGKFVKTL